MARSNVTKVWASAELVTAADLNQVAENANPQRDWTQSNNFAAAIAMSALNTFVSAFSVSHTPRTTRVRVSITFGFENTSGGSVNYHLTVMHGAASPTTNVTGSATAGLISDTVGNTNFSGGHVEFILTGLTPGTAWFFGLGTRRGGAGAAATLRTYNIVIEDI